MGQRATTGAPDVTDAVFAWADNVGPSDNMVFAFLTEGFGGVAGDLSGAGVNGREIVRYTNTSVGADLQSVPLNAELPRSAGFAILRHKQNLWFCNP